MTQSSTHSRLAERGSRQAIQAKPDHPNGVVSPSRGLPNNMQQVALAKNRPICLSCLCLCHKLPLVKSVADFLMYPFQDRKLQPSTIDGTHQPLLISWETRPLTSAKMKISLVSWIVSTETDPKAGVKSPPGTSPWPCSS